MNQYVLFLFLGLGLGAVYASIGMGLVLTYRGTGVINFAVAAVATVPVYVYNELERNGQFKVIAGIPAITTGTPSKPVALLVALAVAGALGALIHFAVSNPLRHAPVLARIVASVGVLGIVAANLGLAFGTETRNVVDLLPGTSVTIAGATIPVPRLWLVALTLLVGGALAAWTRLSKTGLAIQASAENERSAGLAGLSPQRLALVTWMLATVLTSLVLVCAGSILSPLTPSATQILVVPGLAVAIVGRLRSLVLALVSGLVMGALTAVLTYMSGVYTWWPSWARQGISTAIPFIVIVIALYTVGSSIPSRGDEATSPLPPVVLPRNRPWMVALLTVAALVALLGFTGTNRFGLITTLASLLIMLSIVLLTGMVGQVTLAQAAFAGVTGFVLMKLQDGVPFPLSAIIAIVIATLVGVAVALPALRIRGAQLAVVTLAAALVLQDLVFNNVRLLPVDPRIPAPHIGGLSLAIQAGSNIARWQFGVLTLTLVVIVTVVVANVMRGGYGRRLLGVRSNERAAASIGISVEATKVTAFAMSAALAGLGGVLISYSYGAFSAATFSAWAGLTVLAAAYVGGITSVSGAIVASLGVQGGIVYVLIAPHVGAIQSYYDLVAGLLLVLTVLLNPNGIAGKVHEDLNAFRERRRRIAATPLGDDAADESRAQAWSPSPSVAEVSSATRTIGDVVLRATGVGVNYGGLVALNDLDLEVRAGEIVGLIGPNGSGKTTFVDAISGFVPARGRVVVGDAELNGRSPHDRARHGLVRTWQSLELFADLSSGDNVRLATEGSTPWRLLRDAVAPNRDRAAAAEEAISLLQLEEWADKKPSELPLGRQKLLGVARALAMRPRVLVLDEPAAGLDNNESAEFGRYLRAVAATGVGCLLIDHDMGLVMGVCDRVYVIEFGHLIAAGAPDEVRRSPRVIEAYLGSAADPADEAIASVAGALATEGAS
ncbi:MAG: ATP-binding cassette domain-containing protein [Ilumatobacteraceae bacterium]